MKTKIIQEGDKVCLDGIEGWSPSEKVSSVHAALEASMNALGEDISYDYLVGISSLAFRMQVGGLCPSSPHPACGYECTERALQVIPWKFKGYGLDQNKKDNPKELWDIIVQSIDKGFPVITGEEEDGLVIGYQNENKEFICLHPWRHNGEKPFLVSSLAEICWGIGVITERKTETIDQRDLVIKSLKQAVTMANTNTADSYVLGFKAWAKYIKILKSLDGSWKKIRSEDMLGNAWIYECLVQDRKVAVKYLRLIEDHFDDSIKKNLRNAAALYSQMSQNILTGDKKPNEIAPYPDSAAEGVTWTKEMRQEQIRRLEEAKPLEVQAINEIEKALSLISS